MSSSAVDTVFHVRYAETDAMGIVHHASYIVWFEEGRSAYMRACGLPYSEVERRGYWFAVAEVSARFHAPARYDDQVLVRTRLAELHSRGLTFIYEIRRAVDDTLLVTGETRHVCIDRAGAVRRIPDELVTALCSGSGKPRPTASETLSNPTYKEEQPMKQTIHTEKAPRPAGPYSQGVITSGRTLYVAGQGPADPTTGQIPEGAEAQITRCLENVKAIVEAAGASMADVIKVNAYLKDMAHFPIYNEIYRRYFPEPYPARTTVQSDLPGFLIEIDAIVALPGSEDG